MSNAPQPLYPFPFPGHPPINPFQGPTPRPAQGNGVGPRAF